MWKFQLFLLSGEAFAKECVVKLETYAKMTFIQTRWRKIQNSIQKVESNKRQGLGKRQNKL